MSPTDYQIVSVSPSNVKQNPKSTPTHHKKAISCCVTFRMHMQHAKEYPYTIVTIVMEMWIYLLAALQKRSSGCHQRHCC
jgi:hypothetical protein